MKNFVSAFSVFIIWLSVLVSACQPQQQTSASNYELCVYGATPAGIAAAIMAARHGVDVLLVDYSHHVGGMITSGLNTAEINHMLENTISGFPREFYVRLGERFYDTAYYSNFSQGRKLYFKEGDPAFFYESKHAETVLLEMLQEAGVERWMADTLTQLKKEGSSIQTITFSSGRTVHADYFIDATYEGDLMALAGVTYTFGRESRETYDEPLAGIRFVDDTLSARTVDEQGQRLPFFNSNEGLREGMADQRVMNYNFRPIMTRVDTNKLPLYPPEAYDASDFDFLADYLQSQPDMKLNRLIGMYPRGNGKYEFNNRQYSLISLGMFNANTGYTDGDWQQRNQIIREHERWTKGYLYFLATDPRVPAPLQQEAGEWGYAKDEFKDNNNFPYYLYVREGRRMQGAVIQTQHDVFENRAKEDAIFLGSHWIDSHHVQRVALSDSTFTNEGRIWEEVHEPYEISFRTLLPKKEECDNLLVPVAASFSHVAFCSFRVEPSWMQAGHSSGSAVALALQQNIDLHSISIKALQQQLKKEGMIIKLEEAALLSEDRFTD